SHLDTATRGDTGLKAIAAGRGFGVPSPCSELAAHQASVHSVHRRHAGTATASRLAVYLAGATSAHATDRQFRQVRNKRLKLRPLRDNRRYSRTQLGDYKPLLMSIA